MEILDKAISGYSQKEFSTSGFLCTLKPVTLDGSSSFIAYETVPGGTLVATFGDQPKKLKSMLQNLTSRVGYVRILNKDSSLRSYKVKVKGEESVRSIFTVSEAGVFPPGSSLNVTLGTSANIFIKLV